MLSDFLLGRQGGGGRSILGGRDYTVTHLFDRGACPALLARAISEELVNCRLPETEEPMHVEPLPGDASVPLLFGGHAAHVQSVL